MESDQTLEDLLRSSTTAILVDENNGLKEFSITTASTYLKEYADLLYQLPDTISQRAANQLYAINAEDLNKTPQFALLAVALAYMEVCLEKIGITNLPNT